MGELKTLVREFQERRTHLDPTKAREKAGLLLQKLRDYPQDDKDAYENEPRMVRGFALYYLREIYSKEFLADAVSGADTDPDDKVNEALLAHVRPRWMRTKRPYRIKPPFCNDRYTHKFVDEWYAERRYAIGIYGSIVVQLPSTEHKNPKEPNRFHTFIGWWFAQGWVTDALMLFILLLGWLLPWWGLGWAGVVYPLSFLWIVIVGGYLWHTRGAHVLKAVVPRLAACAIVGLVPPLVTEEGWEFAFRLWKTQLFFWGLMVVLLVASWLYLFIETHNSVGKGKLSGWRAFHILLRLCNFALFFSWWATTVAASLHPQPAVITYSVRTVFGLQVTPLPCLLFAAIAVFIGIFLQILWHERPITSRL